MIKLTQKEFYEIIGPLDIVVNSRYTKNNRTEFSTREKRLVGYCNYVNEDQHGFGEKEYFICPDFLSEQKRGES